MTNKMHNSVNNFYSTAFSCCAYFERITCSSSGALPNILYHAVWYYRYNCADSPARLYWLYCVIQYIRQCSWWWTSNSFKTCTARQNGGIKIIYRILQLIGHYTLLWVNLTLCHMSKICLFQVGLLHLISLQYWLLFTSFSLGLHQMI